MHVSTLINGRVTVVLGENVSEQYRFMRYYLPGSLLLIYMIGLIVPNLSDEAIGLLNPQAIIGIFAGAFVASPTIGYMIYGFYNHIYEHWAGKKEERYALKYLEDLEFVKENNRDHYKKQLRCFIQKKEFLDLLYHSTLEKDGEIKIDSKIIETLKNHLSNFAARVVCGLFVPLFSFLLLLPTMAILVFLG